MARRSSYGALSGLVLVVSLCLNYLPSTQAKTEIVGAIGRGRDFSTLSVEYLNSASYPDGKLASSQADCCHECRSAMQFPQVQMFSYKNNVCRCFKTKPGVNPTTRVNQGSFIGLCSAGRGRGRAQRRRRDGRRGRGQGAGGSTSATRNTPIIQGNSETLEADPAVCLDLVACVQCQQFESGEYMDGEDDVDQEGVKECDKCQFKPMGVELKEEGWEGFPSLADDPMCTFIDDDMCSFSFRYRYHINGGFPMVWVQKNKKC